MIKVFRLFVHNFLSSTGYKQFVQSDPPAKPKSIANCHNTPQQSSNPILLIILLPAVSTCPPVVLDQETPNIVCSLNALPFEIRAAKLNAFLVLQIAHKGLHHAIF